MANTTWYTCFGPSPDWLVKSVILFLAMSVIPAFCQGTYYVSPSGLDTNPGTSASPWLTIQHAASTVAAGSTVNIEAGTYVESINVTVTGTSSAQTVFNCESGAIVSGTGLTPSTAHTQGLWNLGSATPAGVDVNYITIQGCLIENYTTTSPSATPAGIWISGALAGIRILNNTVYNITTCASSSCNAFGIAAYGTETTAINELVISGNTVYDCKTGGSETVNVDGNVTNFTITNNIIHDNDNIGIDAIGGEGVGPSGYDFARYGEISGNTVYNISAIDNPGEGDQYDADGIYCDTCAYVIIERNLVYACDLNIEVASEHSGEYSQYVTVRNNVVYDSNSVGISIGGYESRVGGSRYVAIVNNTLYGDDSKSTKGGEFQVQYHATDNVWMNNIAYATSQGLLINNYTTSAAPVSNNYNLYYSPLASTAADFIWLGTTHTGFATYQSASGQDANSAYENPQFVSTSIPTLSVQTGSPAINAGNTLESLPCSNTIGETDSYWGCPLYGTLDFAGNSRLNGSNIDIGAYEFPPTVDVTVGTSPAGLAFSVDGTSYGSAQSFTWIVGSLHAIATTTPQTPVPGAQYTFTSWSDGGALSHSVTASESTTSYTAMFGTQYLLTTAASPTAAGTVSPPTGYQTAGSSVSLVATPAAGYAFVNWTSSPNSVESPTSTSTTITMGAAESVTATFTAHSPGIYAPVNNATLTGNSATFQWGGYPGATAYWVDIGSTASGNNYYSSGNLGNVYTTSTSNLPTNGTTIYVTLYALIGGSWTPNAYTYTAYSPGTAGVMQTPTPNSMLGGSSVTFSWSVGTNATNYWIDISAIAPGGNDVYSSGKLGNVLTVTVNGVPTSGSLLYVTLYSLVGVNWLSNQYTYTAFSATSAAGILTTPTPGGPPYTILPGSTVTFDWTAGIGASAYWVDISAIAPGGNDVYSSGNLGNVLSVTVNGVPTNGGLIYVTLYSLIGSQWVSNQYTYTALNSNGGLAVMQSPSPGSTLSGNTVTFTWSSDANATAYWVDMSNIAAGGNDLDSSGNLGLAHTETVYNLPANSTSIYVTLYSLAGGQWLSTAATYVSGP